MSHTIHIDGGARGNPGPAGAGVTISDGSGCAVFEAGFFLGHETNNVAEYTALLKSLEVAGTLGAEELDIFSDSQLLVRQLNGDYAVRNPTLKNLFDEAYALLRSFNQWRINHVRRADNKRADELANEAMDAGEDVIVLEAPAAAGEGDSKRPQGDGDTTIPVLVVECLQASDVCEPMNCAGQTWTFENTVPDGICVDAARAIIEAVVESRTKSGKTTVRCGKKGCAARFKITPAK